MAKDVLITPANGIVEFKDTSGNVDATIQLDDTGDLIIATPGGDLQIGNTASDLYIGDGVNSVDIIFEQNGAVRALSGKTLTLGQSDSSISVSSPTTFSSGIIKSTNSNSPDTTNGIKFGRDSSQYYTFHGGSGGNYLTSVSTSGNPKDCYIAASRDSGSTFRQYRFASDTYTIYAGANTVWHQGNDGSGSGLDADTVDGIQGSGIVTTTTITNYTINPRFSSTIGFGNDTEVLYFNDATNQTRSGYWAVKDGFEIRGDGNSKDAVVLLTGHLDLTQNAWIEKNIGVGGNFIANGSVGIGTTSPARKLEVIASADIAGQFVRTSSATNARQTTVNIIAETSANMVDGFGTLVNNQIKDSAGVLNSIGNFGFVRSGADNSGSFYIQTINAGSPADSLVITPSGNLGLGVTPSAWGTTNASTLQLKNCAISGLVTNDLHLSSNAYFDGTNWKYIASSVAASNYYQSSGAHVWRTAPSGTAGDPITFTQAMTLDASGNLTLSNGRLTAGKSGVVLVGRNSSSFPSPGDGYFSLETNNTDGDNGGITIKTLASGTLSERARITSAGNLGIGTSAPSSQLHLTGATTIGASTNARPAFKPTNWGYSSSYRVLLIGSTSTDYTVANTGAVTVAFNYDPSANPNGSFSGNGSEILFRRGTSFLTPNSGDTAFNQQLTMIDGNVGIGTSSPTGKLSVSLASATGTGGSGGLSAWDSTYAVFGNTAATSAAVGIGFNTTNGGVLTSLAPNTAWQNMNYLALSHRFYISGAEQMRLDSSGNVGIGTTSPSQKLHVIGQILASDNITAYSDARLKKNVITIENALDKVKKLRGVSYDRIDTEQPGIGVIAQEVMSVLSEVVQGSEETQYSVAYGNMVGLLIEAIKEQQKQIEELKELIKK
jgi:hypothetical protein